MLLRSPVKSTNKRKEKVIEFIFRHFPPLRCYRLAIACCALASYMHSHTNHLPCLRRLQALHGAARVGLPFSTRCASLSLVCDWLKLQLRNRKRAEYNLALLIFHFPFRTYSTFCCLLLFSSHSLHLRKWAQHRVKSSCSNNSSSAQQRRIASVASKKRLNKSVGFACMIKLKSSFLA